MSDMRMAANSTPHSIQKAMRPSIIYRALGTLVFTAALASCSDGNDSGNIQDDGHYSALIERTQYGTAHITADDWGSLGFGQGYATAQDRFCVIADQMLKVRSQRARYFGPGEGDKHILSDYAYLVLGVMDRAPSILASWPAEGQAHARGYVAGLNKYLKDTGPDNLPEACAGQEWVREISIESLIAYTLSVSMLAGSTNFISEIANAAPPQSGTVNDATISGGTFSPAGASNAIAIGSDMSANGRGLLLANPHWPWEGERKFHEIHLTIPGEIDVAGITLPGIIGVMLGFNDDVAWTRTTSESNQFIVYTLELVPGNTKRYRYDDEERDMEEHIYSIEVKQTDGSVTQKSRTFYRSHYGPMLDLSAYGLGWSDTAAATIFDINADNVASTFGPTARVKSVNDLRDVYMNVGGAPGQNTTATDREGRVFFGDTTLVPNLSEKAEQAFRLLVEGEDFSFTKVAYQLGLVVLDGSDSFFSVEVDNKAAVPGSIPFSEAPQLVGRRDFVTNSNDSYWLSNPNAPLIGYSLRYGKEKSPRRLRTRMGLTQLSESEIWDRADLKGLLFANRSYTKELWRDQFVSYCSQFQIATSSTGEIVNIGDACEILSNWDGLLNLDSIGAIVNRELLSAVDIYGMFGGKSYFSVPFDPLDPVATPRGLNEEGKAFLLTQLADAVLRLQQVGIPLNAPLGDYEYTLAGNKHFAIHGGRSHTDGAFNIAAYALKDARWNSTLIERIPRPPLVNESTALFETGYLTNFGSSFILAVEFSDDGPVADAILAYSESDDPDSPHFADQIELYSSKIWRPLPFTREQIEADPFLKSMRVTN